MDQGKALEGRRAKLYDRMAREEIALAVFEDTEERRDPSIRWMTGHPADALLFLSADRRSLLVPWDINIAEKYARADTVLPYSDFERQPLRALRSTAEHLGLPRGSRIEIPPLTPHPLFLKYREELSGFDVLCRKGGIHDRAEEFRALKDEEEIRIYRRGAALTNEIIGVLEDAVRTGSVRTETDVALLIEAEGRKRGCEGTGFETLAAGPERSFAIHAFPPYTAAAFAGPGLSVLDFGLVYEGYTTDVTISFARNLSKAQKNLVRLVETAYALTLSLAKEGSAARDLASAADDFFGKSEKAMPHALGHGIGLRAHEAPVLRNRSDNGWILKAGMIFTLEPGLYDPALGGCRLENDVLLSPSGTEVLTAARIIQL
jgi:Xaa-Pro dipeptidase